MRHLPNDIVVNLQNMKKFKGKELRAKLEPMAKGKGQARVAKP